MEHPDSGESVLRDKIIPKISVVMAAYNEEQTIRSAITSILEQTFADWELIIVDDTSTDSTSTIVKEFQEKDQRIRLLVNQSNLGLAASLNRGIAIARGKYIARMDADDTSYPDRLHLQKEFLETNQEIAVVGGNADLADELDNVIRSTKMPRTPEEINRLIVKMCPLIHPSVMYRLDFIQKMGGYDERLRRKQDYDLWLRGIRTHNYANVGDTIIRYRFQTSKPLATDLYGFYVRLMNAHRRRDYLGGVFWAFVVLGVNVMRKFGYRQRMHRSGR